MQNAKANYIVSAQDATKDAIRSALANFRSLDAGVKATARGVNLALGVIAGAGLKNLFRNALEAAADASGKNSEFAKSLDDVKRAARDLMVPKTGLPGVTENLKELAATLKDPAVQSAADAFFSGLIRGGSAAINVLAQTTAGIRVLATQKGGNSQVDLDSKIIELQKLLKGIDANPRNSVAKAAREDIQRQIETLQRSYSLMQQLQSGSNFGSPLAGIGGGSEASRLIDQQVASFDRAEASAKDYAETVKDLQKTLDSLPAEFSATASANVQETLRQQQETSEAAAAFYEETQARGRELAARGAEETRKMLEEVSEFSREAFRNIQDALAQFLFDPFHAGLKGMLSGFVDTLRKMIAEAGASKILNILGGLGKGGSGFLSTIGSFFGGFRAQGGPLESGKWYIAGEKGPEPIWGGGPGAFASGYGGSQSASVVNVHVDARGATSEGAAGFRRAMPELVKQIENQVITKLRRGNYEARLA